MIIGIPKEIKNNENRVAMTPAGVHELVKHGHTVLVQKTAGEGSGFSDEDYVSVGVQMIPTIEEVYAKAEMIIKVKEPIEPEYKLVRKDQLLFTYLHFASSEPLTKAMIESGAVCLAYETPRRPLFTVAYSYVGSGWKNVCAGGYVFPRTPARRQRCAARGCSGCQAG